MARALERLLQPAGHILLHEIERNGRQEFAVRENVQPLAAAGNAGEALDIIIPGGDVFITDRPVDGDAFFRIGLEIGLRPAIGLTAPEQRAAADMITAEPVEPLFLDIGRFLLIGPHAERCLFQQIIAAENGIFRLHFLRGAVAMGVIPGFLVGILIVGDVLDVAAALQHQDLQALLREFLCGPASTDARADNNRIIMIVCHDNSSDVSLEKTTGQSASRRDAAETGYVSVEPHAPRRTGRRGAVLVLLAVFTEWSEDVRSGTHCPWSRRLRHRVEGRAQG
ncbi:hypothetical protein D3C86_1159540 [compost metagenome]